MDAPQRVGLVERKRRQARGRIVRAAEELFSERGFDAVSVADIADRADVGRTTFFRHFGDKQEVVFAQEEELVGTITAAHDARPAIVPTTPAAAITQLRDIVLALCQQATADPESYRRHGALLDQHPELLARDALKMQRFAGRLAGILVARGADEPTAQFAAQIALACYQTAKARHHNDPHALVADTHDAFERVLALGREVVGDPTTATPVGDMS